MQGFNLDLLQTTPYRADGTARDPHARHVTEHLALRRAARQALWQARLARLRAVLTPRQALEPPVVLPNPSTGR